MSGGRDIRGAAGRIADCPAGQHFMNAGLGRPGLEPTEHRLTGKRVTAVTG